jgi:resuscitation-promoting factor RpfB
VTPTPLGTIARHLAPSPPDDRTFRRRRLASLAAVLALVLGVGSLVDAGRGDVVDVTTDMAAGGEVVRAASVGTPTGVRELLSETTTTLVEATGATTTTTTQAPATTLPATTAPTTAPDEEPDATTTTTTTSTAPVARALTTDSDADSDAEDEAPATTTTTAPPRPAPSTTAAPTTTTTTTTTASAPESSASSEGYAYDDPRSTQVWHDLAQCESGGNWSIDTGNGYYGGLQFSLASWESVGGSGYPHEHPAATQIEFGRELQARQGWEAWPHCSEQLGLT